MTFQFHADLGPDLVHAGDVGRRQEIEGRREGIVRAAFEPQGRVALRQQERGQNRLQHERRAAGRSDSKRVFAGRDRAGDERQPRRSDRHAFRLGRADPGGRFHRGQVLLHQTGLLSPGPDVVDRDRLSRHQGQRQGRANDLPPLRRRIRQWSASWCSPSSCSGVRSAPVCPTDSGPLETETRDRR